jgi:hypothetical protein
MSQDEDEVRCEGQKKCDLLMVEQRVRDKKKIGAIANLKTLQNSDSFMTEAQDIKIAIQCNKTQT